MLCVGCCLPLCTSPGTAPKPHSHLKALCSASKPSAPPEDAAGFPSTEPLLLPGVGLSDPYGPFLTWGILWFRWGRWVCGCTRGAELVRASSSAPLLSPRCTQERKGTPPFPILSSLPRAEVLGNPIRDPSAPADCAQGRQVRQRGSAERHEPSAARSSPLVGTAQGSARPAPTRATPLSAVPAPLPSRYARINEAFVSCLAPGVRARGSVCWIA